LITIFTPTFNRTHLLEGVYPSLKKQHYTDFDCLIVDDGSTDNTEDAVNELIRKEQNFAIKYIQKKIVVCILPLMGLKFLQNPSLLPFSTVHDQLTHNHDAYNVDMTPKSLSRRNNFSLSQ
jgi:glycosyltransferase involved in cell wall biosynthesis